MQQAQPLPKPFEPDFYRATYTDVAALSDAEVERHYREIGISKGLLGSPAALRSNLIRLVTSERSVLEIGPFQAPAVFGDHVKYLDAYGTDELIRRANEMGLDPVGTPQIDYISPTGSFEMVNCKFSAAFGCHSIEHQPDFIRHLRNVSSVLDAAGRYYIICPDKRYCFDHFCPETTIADIVTAYLLEHKCHQPRSFASLILLMTHNDPERHWSGDHGLPTFKASNTLEVQKIRNHIEATAYVDCHAWRFTPQTFFEVALVLGQMGLTDLYPERVYQTPAKSFEFTAILRKTRLEMPEAFIAGDDDQMRLTSRAEHIEVLTQHAKLLHEQLRQVYASRSWRVTAPIRALVNRLRQTN